MEVQLEDLISRIKDEGIRTADEKAAAIVSDAEKRAAALLESAKSEADSLIKKAEADALRREATGREALKQAARDTIISLRAEIGKLLDGILKTETAKTLKGDSLKEAIVAVIKNWKPDQTGQLTLLVPASESAALDNALRAALAAEMRNGMELKPSSDIQAGFRISGKNGEWFYDFTDEELTAVLSRFLSTSLVKAIAD